MPDRAATVRVQEPEVEITPQMIDAGVKVYLEHCSDTGAGDRLDRDMVQQMFEAMLNHARVKFVRE